MSVVDDFDRAWILGNLGRALMFVCGLCLASRNIKVGSWAGGRILYTSHFLCNMHGLCPLPQVSDTGLVELCGSEFGIDTERSGAEVVGAIELTHVDTDSGCRLVSLRQHQQGITMLH